MELDAKRLSLDRQKYGFSLVYDLDWKPWCCLIPKSVAVVPAAEGQVGFITTDLYLISCCDGLPSAVKPHDHSGFFAAVAYGTYFSHLIRKG